MPLFSFFVRDSFVFEPLVQLRDAINNINYRLFTKIGNVHLVHEEVVIQHVIDKIARNGVQCKLAIRRKVSL